MAETRMLTCDMEHGCMGEVTHIDNKGYVYCAAHGIERRGYRPCRKLRGTEKQRLETGTAIRY